MADPVVSSLTALPFEQILGAPLLAAIEAQGEAALATVDFINNVGFEVPEGQFSETETAKARTIKFRYGRAAGDGTVEDVELTVPLLSLIPVPHLRISELNVDFELKVHQLIQAERTAAKNVSLEAEAKAGFAWFRAKTKMNVTLSTRSSSKSQLDRSATFRVSMQVVQDETPEGLSQVLSLLRDSIRENPTNET